MNFGDKYSLFFPFKLRLYSLLVYLTIISEFQGF
jgi:hypothetical protein